MSRADGKAERDRIEAERAVREALEARRCVSDDISYRKSYETPETVAERHRKIEEKTEKAYSTLREKNYSDIKAPQYQKKTSVIRNGNSGSFDKSARKSEATFHDETVHKKQNVKQNKKKKSPLSTIILVASLFVFVVSAGIIAFKYVIPSYITSSGYREMIGDVDNVEGDQPDWSDVIDNPVNHANGGDSDTDTEITVVDVDDVDINKINYITVNYSKLKAANPDVKGWIYFPGPSSIYGLPINAPLLQGDDNYHYLDYNSKDEKDSNGSVYMSAELSPDLIGNSNTMIYGHAKNPYAFAGLKYLNAAKRWYSDGNNHFIRIKTDNYYSIWQIFSWYESVDGGDFDRIETSDWSEYFDYLQSQNEISEFKKFDFDDDDKIITLVTCKGSSDGRVVVHAKLVRYSPVSE